MDKNKRQVDVVINVGHTKYRGGAKNKLTGINEYSLNSLLAPHIKDRLGNQGINAEIVSGAYWRLPSMINKLNPKLCLSLHCNGFKDPSVSGKEWLYHYRSSHGRMFANNLSNAFKDFRVNDRGIKSIRKGGRGFRLLNKTVCPIVIAEPIFITNGSDLSYFMSSINAVIRCYTTAVSKTLKQYSLTD